MREFLDLLRTGYLQYAEEGQYLGLFFVSLLFLWLRGRIKSKEEERRFFSYAMGITVLVLFPVSAWMLLKYQTPFYTYSQLILLFPVTGILALAGIEVVEAVEIYIEKKRKSLKRFKYKSLGMGVAIFICGMFLFLGGTVNPAQGYGAVNSGWTKIPAPILGVLQALEEEQLEEELLLAPDEVLEYARAYNGKIPLVYGRNMWERSLNAFTYDTYSKELEEIHLWLNPSEELLRVANPPVKGNNMSSYEAIEAIEQSGCQVLILKKEQYEESFIKTALEQRGSFLFARESEKYVILQKRQ